MEDKGIALGSRKGVQDNVDGGYQQSRLTHGLHLSAELLAHGRLVGTVDATVG